MVFCVEKSLDYEVGQKVKSWRLERGYTQKGLAEKIGVKYWVILQYEKGNRKIPIKKLYAIAEALSVNVKGLVCRETLPDEKRYFEDEEILNLVKGYKDKELSEVFYLLTKFIRLSEERSRKAVKIEVARGLMKVGVSTHVISRTTNLSIGEYEENKIPVPYKVGQRIKEWRLIRGYTQK
ncbi:MAG: helix-turn-helix domain-containing protein, partial [Wolbachia sp.]